MALRIHYPARLALAFTAVGAPLCAHGGQYRGPDDVAPPVPGVRRPAENAGPATRTSCVMAEIDLDRWEFWWEFNKDRFLAAPQHARDPAPTDADRQRVAAALLKALESTEQRDINSSCMVALAK